MTPNEMKRLSRGDLLEMLLAMSRENEQLRRESEQLHKQLKERIIAMENCGSIAEASLQLGCVFQAAQAACEQYSQNVRYRVDYQCAQLEQETRAKCEAMIAGARQQAELIIEDAKRRAMQSGMPGGQGGQQ